MGVKERRTPAVLNGKEKERIAPAFQRSPEMVISPDTGEILLEVDAVIPV
jgi:hypothetical protein